MARIVLITVFALVLGCATVATAKEGVIHESPALTVVRHGTSESCIMPGNSYSSFELEGTNASFIIDGVEMDAGFKKLRGGGITKVSWAPAEGGTLVSLEFADEPLSSLINFMPGTQVMPGAAQVLAGFSFDGNVYSKRGRAVLGSRKRGPAADEHGSYKLPDFPDYKYSDTLITLHVQNVDFRDVLWLMSSIGGVSIVLDPYWDQEPTGSRRPVGGGASGAGGGGSGFRPGRMFLPSFPSSGKGDLSLDFNQVPFDTALDLILMSVGLVKVDIWPDS